MSLGFRFRETMSGSYLLDADPDHERAMSFSIGVRVHSLARFVVDRRAEIQGEVYLEGFAAHRALRGTLVIDPLIGKKLVYEFGFTGDDGKSYRFVGQKDVEHLRPLHTMTMLPGELADDVGRRVGSARLRFDARSDLPKFLRSFRAA